MAKGLTVKVKDRDKGWKKLKRTLQATKTPRVHVGVRGDDSGRNEGGISNVALAAVHEFGLSTGSFEMPERSFIRSTMDENGLEYKRLLKVSGGKIYIMLLTPDQALELLGMQVQSDMKRMIEKDGPGDWESLNPRYAYRKGTNKMLVDTSQLKNSITYKVMS